MCYLCQLHDINILWRGPGGHFAHIDVYFLKIIQHLCRGRLQTRDVWGEGGGVWRIPVGPPHPLFHIVQYSEPRNNET